MSDIMGLRKVKTAQQFDGIIGYICITNERKYLNALQNNAEDFARVVTLIKCPNKFAH